MALTEHVSHRSADAGPFPRQQSLLVVTDRSPWGEMASRYARTAGFAVTQIVWQRGDPARPRGFSGWSGDWIVAFKADYVLDSDELILARHGAVNFHPGPPHCRGVGTCEYAIEERWTTYGATCHHMSSRVDAGPIVETSSFPIEAGYGVTALRELTAARLYLLYLGILTRIGRGEKLPVSQARWSGPLHTWWEYEQRIARLGESIRE